MKYYGEIKNALIKNAKSSTSKLILNYLEQNTEFKEKDKIEDKSDKWCQIYILNYSTNLNLYSL